MIEVNLSHHTYPIFIDESYEVLCKQLAPYRKVFILTDQHVASFHLSSFLAKLTLPFESIVLEPGEKIKRLSVYESTVSALITKGIQRSDVLIAFGGGVIGDFTGFVASTLFRGMDYVAVPTSLLACVDSSIGGKVALNLDLGKNLIGAFFHPKAVFIDTTFLSTLPKREYASGMAELLKHGFIYDASLIEDAKNHVSLKRLIEKSLKVKKHYVEQDEFDKSLRMVLNFGHTFGHAIESYENYVGKLHGECVAIGMVMASLIGEALGITKPGTTDTIKQVLTLHHLPTEYPYFDELLPYILRDKKVLSGELNLVLLTQIGQAKIIKVPIESIMAWKEGSYAR